LFGVAKDDSVEVSAVRTGALVTVAGLQIGIGLLEGGGE
jgi:hypothetical protein